MLTLDWKKAFPNLDLDSPAWRKQLKFITAMENKVAYVGGFGSGKTLAGSLRTYMLANHIPGNRIIVARRTYRELQDSTKRTFMEWLPRDLYVGERKSDDIVFLRARNGGVSEVWFRSLNNPEKYKSTEIGAYWIDEATEAKQEEFRLLASRLRLPAASHYRPGFLTTNPCPKSHWLYDEFVTKHEEGSTLLVQASTYDNRHNLPPGYIEELERTYPPDWIDMYLKGEFGITLEGMPVTPQFRPVVEINGVKVHWHVAPRKLEWDRNLSLKRSWDPGRIRPACVVWQVSKKGQWMKLWELMGNNHPGNIFIPMVKRILTDKFEGAHYQDYADPQVYEQNKEDGRSWNDELVDNGIRVIKIPRTSPNARADLMNKMMSQTTRDGEPLIVIDPTCEISIEAYRGGWHRAKPEMGRPIHDDPVKDGYYEHLMDADGYLIVGAYQGMGSGSLSKLDRDKLRIRSKKRRRSYH